MSHPPCLVTAWPHALILTTSWAAAAAGIAQDKRNELKVELWDYDHTCPFEARPGVLLGGEGDDEDEFLGVLVLEGHGDHFLRVDHAEIQQHELAGEKGRVTRFVGGVMSIGMFTYDKSVAQAVLHLREKAVAETGAVLAEKMSSLIQVKRLPLLLCLHCLSSLRQCISLRCSRRAKRSK